MRFDSGIRPEEVDRNRISFQKVLMGILIACVLLYVGWDQVSWIFDKAWKWLVPDEQGVLHYVLSLFGFEAGSKG